MEQTEYTYYLPAAELTIRWPSSVKEPVAFLHCVSAHYAPFQARELFEFQFPTFSFKKVEQLAKRLPPITRRAISSDLTP